MGQRAAADNVQEPGRLQARLLKVVPDPAKELVARAVARLEHCDMPAHKLPKTPEHGEVQRRGAAERGRPPEHGRAEGNPHARLRLRKSSGRHGRLHGNLQVHGHMPSEGLLRQSRNARRKPLQPSGRRLGRRGRRSRLFRGGRRTRWRPAPSWPRRFASRPARCTPVAAACYTGGPAGAPGDYGQRTALGHMTASTG